MTDYAASRNAGAFDADAIVIDPLVPSAARRGLESLDLSARYARWHAHVNNRNWLDVTSPLIPFGASPRTANLPEPPPGRAAMMSSNVRKAVRSVRSGGLPALVSDRYEWADAVNAARIYHRRYMVPIIDLDAEARLEWKRAVGAANKAYQADVMRQRVIDSAYVEVEVPGHLWKIAEGLAKSSLIRVQLRKITDMVSRNNPAYSDRIEQQERAFARESRRVAERVARLEEFASLLCEADAARRLNHVDDLLFDMRADSAADAASSGQAERLRLDAQAVIEQANEAARNLDVLDEDGQD